MSEREDRWASLADELGLPPEPSDKPVSAPPPPVAKAPVAPPPAPPPIEEKYIEPPAPPEVPTPLASEPPWEAPVDLPSITSLDPPTLDPMLEVTADRETMYEDPQATADTDRSRGRGGRRGQRGRRGRNERTEQPRAEAGDVRPPTVPSAGPPAEEGRDDRRRRGRGGRRPPERPPEPEHEELLEPEEETAELEPAFVPAEEVDDGPEDNLDDLNVPSWSDLIASLYRPER